MIHFFLYLPSRKKSEVMYVVYVGYILMEKKMIHAPLCLKKLVLSSLLRNRKDLIIIYHKK